MRIKPRRETRGVSRSKCGDLITACVPVSWATSIIVSESTDAIDYFDGYGTTELVIGIRAYQWGWEYYYPKDLDLSYNLKKNYSTFIGNSLKYEKSSSLSSGSKNFWKFYQNKNFDQIITPAFLLVTPFDNFKLFNFLNFNDIGAHSLHEMNAFKKIKMISKTYTSDLFFAFNDYTNKYKFFSNMYCNDYLFLKSFSYGLKRQHNFLSSKTYFNNNNFLDLNSTEKLLTHNYKTSFEHKYSLQNNFFFFNKNNINLNFFYNNKFFNFFQTKNYSSQLAHLSTFENYFSFLNSINDDSDKKKIIYPFFKFFNKKFKKLALMEKNNFNKINFINELNLLKNQNDTTSFFFNKNNSFKKFDLNSLNQSIIFNDKSIRGSVNLKTNVSSLNYSKDTNLVSSYFNLLKNKTELNNFFFFNTHRTNWLDSNFASKLFLNKFFLDNNYTPVVSSNASINLKNYDNSNSKKTFVDTVPLIFQGKDEATPTFLTSIYWNFYWSNSTFEWRFLNSNFLKNKYQFFYLPIFNFYYDYDFRNWQSFELLEDAYWESAFSIYQYDENLALKFDFYNPTSIEKENNEFFTINKNLDLENEFALLLTVPFFKDTSDSGESVSSYFYLDDYVSDSSLILTNNFFFIPFSLNFINSEDAFENFKGLQQFFGKFNTSFFLNVSPYFKTLISSLVLDSFRSDFDEFSWINEESESFKNNNFPFILNMIVGRKYRKYTFFEENFFSSQLAQNNIIFEKNKVNERFSNNINLRSTAKNSIVTYNAIQKVFRTRFDENRSHTKLHDFSNFSVKQPFIGSKRVSYENILGKNKISFYKPVLFKDSFNLNFNQTYFNETSLNFYFYDFPFLLAMKSDASRYFWFDWFSKWGFYEVQPSSSSRYAIYGMPYFNKSFEFSSNFNEVLNETETYSLRMGRSRRNYLPNWVYTPYFYAKNHEWRKNNIFFEIFSKRNSSLTGTKYILKQMNWFWSFKSIINFNSKHFLPSQSGLTSYNRTNWKPQNFVQSYYYHTSSLIDILTKREYLYREYFLKNNRIINLPYYLTSTPRHPLIKELKSSFLFVDKIIYNNEYSRDAYLSSLKFFNYIFLKTLIDVDFSFLNFKKLNDYFFYYFFNINENFSSNSNNLLLYKNQYRPMKKGITNMVRLHATGAIAMPTEIRIQVLASSKDVIHSWAIPSAGIKIDCVPGYSSHRVMIFLVSGIFWGQCMEICGRYHHWMPIIVYFMKRDLFFLWCSHFIFLNPNNSTWSMNDRQNADYLRLASFDKNSWLSELKTL